jgi:hypothetical protein
MKVKEKKLVDETLGETEGARRATRVSPNASPPAGPGSTTMGSETEVVAKAQRRRFTAEYKRRIVREADRCTTTGAIGGLLRREARLSNEHRGMLMRDQFGCIVEHFLKISFTRKLNIVRLLPLFSGTADQNWHRRLSYLHILQ